MKGKLVDVPFTKDTIIRTVFEILESHDVNGITVIDKAKVKELYVINKDTLIVDNKITSQFTTKGDKDE